MHVVGREAWVVGLRRGLQQGGGAVSTPLVGVESSCPKPWESRPPSPIRAENGSHCDSSLEYGYLCFRYCLPFSRNAFLSSLAVTVGRYALALDVYLLFDTESMVIAVGQCQRGLGTISVSLFISGDSLLLHCS
jgi:hypothetical protein